MTQTFSRKLGLPALTLASLVGCSQILGLNDYDIDPTLDDSSGGSRDDGRGGSAKGGSEKGGNSTTSGGQGLGGNEAAAGNGGSASAGMPAGGAGGADGEGGQGGAGIPEEVVICDSAACCATAGGVAVGTELLEDGGFELGRVIDGLTPWTQVSTNDEEIVTSGLGYSWKPKAGDYFAYLAGIAGETSTLYSEDLTLKPNAGWVVLSGYRLFQLDSTKTGNDDFSGIGFYSYDQVDPVELPFFWAKAGNGSMGFGESANWTRFEASWDAAPHIGKKRYLGIRGSADMYFDDMSIDASSYLYDDVSLKAFTCVK